MKTNLFLILLVSIIPLMARTDKDCDMDWFERQQIEDNANRRAAKEKAERDMDNWDQELARMRDKAAADKARKQAEFDSREIARRQRAIQDQLDRIESQRK